MNPLEVTLMARGPARDHRLRALVQEFETQHKIPVHLTLLDWSTGWGELVRVALYNVGPDVSEVGTTWVSDFMGMNAVRPFQAAEIAQWGGAKAFFASAWNSGVAPHLQPLGVWSAPFLVDTRFLAYRRDWLAQAGIAEATAFATPAQMLATLAQLAAAGCPGPLALPTVESYVVLQQLASWVWGAGGHFFSENAHHTAFMQPAALAGMRDYFALGAFTGPARQALTPEAAEAQFANDQAAVVFTGPWMLAAQLPETVRTNLGVAFPPGVPFVGGSNLVVWKHTHHESAALKLIKYLTQADVQRHCGELSGLLPARLATYDTPPFSTHEHYQRLRAGLPQGRAHQSFALWGMAEDQLRHALAQIWSAVLTTPSVAIDELLHQYLEPVARRLDVKLQAQ